MDAQRYLRALHKGWWIVLLGLVVGLGAAFAYVAVATPVYAAKLSFLVGVATPDGGQATASPDSISQFLQAQATTYAQLASSGTLATRVAADSDVRLPPGAIASKVSGAATLNTQLFSVTVEDTNASRAQAIAEAIAVQYPRLVSKLSRTVGSGTPVALTVTNPPKVRDTPISPRKSLDIAAGAIAGLVLGLILAVLRELQDTAVRTPEQVTEMSGRPVLAEISHDPGARRTPLVIDQPDGQRRAEEYRHLRTNLSFLDAADPVQVLVITSCTSYDGKSTTSANLGLVVAETEVRVLLIEADMRRPKLSSMLGLERDSGLSNVLAGQVDVADVLQTWGEDQLSVLASGPLPPNPSELLAGQRMTDLIARLRDDFDLIIIDTPPLLAVTDGAVASRLADGVLLVVRHGGTKRNQLGQVLHVLSNVNTRLLGSVLTMQPRRGVDKSYSGSAYYTRADDEHRAPAQPPAKAAETPIKAPVGKRPGKAQRELVGRRPSGSAEENRS